MKIGLRRKTDEEIISLVRNAYRRIDCWKWALISVFFAFFTVIVFVALTNICYPHGLEILIDRSNFQFSPTVYAYLIGSSIGFAVGFFVSLFGFLVVNIFVELRTWNLLITYHDRLQQAGLLPIDPAEKMESAEREPPRN